MTAMRKSIKELAPETLREWLGERGYPAYRAAQVEDWLFKQWAADFSGMANLPGRLREEMATAFACLSLSCLKRWQSRDGTVKFLLRLADGETVETVLIPAGKRRTVCLSTQVGCPVGCAFCATGRQGFVRDLTAAEIFDQIVFCCRELAGRPTNLVVMGMGEPLLNFDSMTQALNLACSNRGLGLAARRFTISTTGIPEPIRALADLGRQWNLSWSLHAVDDETRAGLIPPAHRFPIREVLEACRYYRQQTGRKVTLEYALIAGLNDRKRDAEGLSRLAREIDAKVNLLRCHPTGGIHRASGIVATRQFLQCLSDRGVVATLRESRGEDIAAACGQLRGDHIAQWST